MKATHIVMLLTNPFLPDPRVAREAEALCNAGFRVTVLAWDREVKYPLTEEVGGYTVNRIRTLRTSYGRGFNQVMYIPRFWKAAIRSSHSLKPDIVHCHDLDTLPAGYWIKRNTGAFLLYDAHEDYPALMAHYLPRFMIYLLAWLERFLLGNVDQAIAASSNFTTKLRNQGFSRIETIGNYQTLEPFNIITETDISIARAHLGLDPQDYVVTYIGGFNRNRLLLPLIEAVRELDNVQLLLFGDGPIRDSVETAIAGVSNVRYMGWLPSNQVPLHTCMADVIYYCLQPGYPGSFPNALTSAMAAGRPIIANDIGDLGQIIRETGCGLLLDEVTPTTIRQAIQTLRDPILRRKMGERGRHAAETQHNWQAAARRLIAVYQKIIATDE